MRIQKYSWRNIILSKMWNCYPLVLWKIIGTKILNHILKIIIFKLILKIWKLFALYVYKLQKIYKKIQKKIQKEVI